MSKSVRKIMRFEKKIVRSIIWYYTYNFGLLNDTKNSEIHN